MEQYTNTIRYWLLKPTNKNNNFYIRVKSDSCVSYSWSIGYKNEIGSISLVTNIMDKEISLELENEFQEELNKERKEFLNYEIKM